MSDTRPSRICGWPWAGLFVMMTELVMDLETVAKLEARVSGTWEEQDVCSVRSFLEHNPELSPADKENVLQGQDEVYLNLGAGGAVRLVAQE